MESEDRKPIFTRRLILTILVVILLVLIILLLLRKCGNGGPGDDIDNFVYISVTPTTVNLEPNGNYPVYAEIQNSTNPIYWSVQDESCVTLSQTMGNSTTITAGKQECSTVVTAYSGETNTQIPVTVRKVTDNLEGLQLNKQNYIVYVGKSALASVTAVPTTAPLPELVYEIDDTSIATVNENGVIKGVKEGTTRLTVRTIDGIYTATSTVTVKKKASSSDQQESNPTYVAASGLEFKSTNAKEVCVGQQIILGYTIKPDNATNKKVRWNVNNPTDKNGLVNEYSSINANGYLTGIKAGTTKVTIISEDNPNLTATTTITVLSSSSSKCKSNNGSSGGGSSSGGSSSSTTGTSQTSTGTSGGMSCTVSGEVGNNGWYKTLTITWKGSNLTSDDGNYDRKYCIEGQGCNDMPGYSYSYSPASTSALPRFWYTYKNKNGTEIEVTTAKSGGCDVTQKGLDRENPTCEIRLKKENGNVKVYVVATDEISGVKTINLNGSTLNSYSEFKRTATSNEVTMSSSTSQNYSALVYDQAGRVGNCSATIKSDGTSDVLAYPKKIVLTTNQSTVLKSSTLSFEAYIRYSNGTLVIPSISDFSASGGTISGTGPNFTFTPNESATKGSVGLSTWGFDSTTNKETKLSESISFTIASSNYEPKVGMNVSNGTLGDNGWYKSSVNVSLSVTEIASDDKVTTAKICAGSGCTPNSSSLSINKTGTTYIYYTLKTSKLGDYAIAKYLGNMKIDLDNPACTVSTTGENSYHVTFNDEGSGLASYSFNGKSANLSGNYSSATITGKYDNSTITVYDKAGRSGTCSISSASKLKISAISLGYSTVTLENYAEAKSVAVRYLDENGKVINDDAVKGFSITKIEGGANCFEAYKNNGSIGVKSINKSTKNDCSGVVTINSTYNNEVVANLRVNVSKTAAKQASISCGTLADSGSGRYYASISVSNIESGYKISYSPTNSNLSCGSTVTATSSTYVRSCTATAAGTYSVIVTVTDADGNSAGSESCGLGQIGSTDSGYSCGTVVGENTTWTNQNVTIKQYCKGSDCAQAYYQKTFTTTTPEGKGTIVINDTKNNSKNCYVNAYVDKTLPTCSYGTVPDSNKWYNGDVNLQIKCVDNDSGCHKDADTRTIKLTKSGTYNYGVMDNANNVAMCGSITVKIDKTPPTFSCNVTSETKYGVSGKCTCTDSDSGCSSKNTASFNYYTYPKDICGEDNAGNKKCVRINVTKISTKTCPSGTIDYGSDSYCRKNISSNPTGCSSSYTYSSATGKCVKTTTTYGEGTWTDYRNACDGKAVLAGDDGSKYYWSCTFTNTTPAYCTDNRVMVDGKCYEKVDKILETIYREVK